METLNLENQGMLKMLEHIYSLIREEKQISFYKIREKTGIELKYWDKLISGGIIKRTGWTSKPIYKWAAIEPNIYMATETLKDIPHCEYKEIFTDENSLEYKKEYRKQLTKTLVPSEIKETLTIPIRKVKAEIAREKIDNIKELQAQGFNYREISSKLDIGSIGTITKLLLKKDMVKLDTFNFAGISAAIILDTRRMKENDSYPIKYRIIHERKQYYICTGFYANEEAWGDVLNNKFSDSLDAEKTTMICFAFNQIEKFIKNEVKGDGFVFRKIQNFIKNRGGLYSGYKKPAISSVGNEYFGPIAAPLVQKTEVEKKIENDAVFPYPNNYSKSQANDLFKLVYNEEKGLLWAGSPEYKENIKGWFVISENCVGFECNEFVELMNNTYPSLFAKACKKQEIKGDFPPYQEIQKDFLKYIRDKKKKEPSLEMTYKQEINREIIIRNLHLLDIQDLINELKNQGCSGEITFKQKTSF